MNFSSSGNFLGKTCEVARLKPTKSTYGGKIFHYQGNVAEFTQGKVFACKEGILKKEMPEIISTMQYVSKTDSAAKLNGILEGKKIKNLKPSCKYRVLLFWGIIYSRKCCKKTPHLRGRGDGCRQALGHTAFC